eukprot:9595697-Alexandrium_andersonii.AAC.1
MAEAAVRAHLPLRLPSPAPRRREGRQELSLLPLQCCQCRLAAAGAVGGCAGEGCTGRAGHR